MYHYTYRFLKQGHLITWMFSLLTVLIFPFSIYSEPLLENHVQAKLISEVMTVQPGYSFWVAISFTMNPGWHTYWKNPGDSGLPTKITWSLPQGFKAGDTQWPYPEKFKSDHITSYGYMEEIYLLTEIQVPQTLRSGSLVEIKALVVWLECNEICIPGKAELTLTLPVKDKIPKQDNRWIKQFALARKNLPFSSSNWQISARDNQSEFILQLIPPAGLKDEILTIFFFPEEKEMIDHVADQELSRFNSGYRLKLRKSPYAQKPTERLSGILITQTGRDSSGLYKALKIDIPVKKD
jgi:DsbC/DsbD-like thiol-disulfide interchange protein